MGGSHYYIQFYFCYIMTTFYSFLFHIMILFLTFRLSCLSSLHLACLAIILPCFLHIFIHLLCGVRLTNFHHFNSFFTCFNRSYLVSFGSLGPFLLLQRGRLVLNEQFFFIILFQLKLHLVLNNTQCKYVLKCKYVS